MGLQNGYPARSSEKGPQKSNQKGTLCEEGSGRRCGPYKSFRVRRGPDLRGPPAWYLTFGMSQPGTPRALRRGGLLSPPVRRTHAHDHRPMCPSFPVRRPVPFPLGTSATPRRRARGLAPCSDKIHMKKWRFGAQNPERRSAFGTAGERDASSQPPFASSCRCV